MRQEALEIALQESEVPAPAEAEGIAKESKCPYAQNGAASDESTDEGATEGTTNPCETNGVAAETETAPNDKPMGLGSFKVAKIETVKENLKEQSLTVEQINDYCKSLFIFKSIRVMRFK